MGKAYMSRVMTEAGLVSVSGSKAAVERHIDFVKRHARCATQAPSQPAAQGDETLQLRADRFRPECIAQAFWEVSDSLYEHKDDARFFPVLQQISDRAEELQAAAPPASAAAGVVLDEAMKARAGAAYSIAVNRYGSRLQSRSAHEVGIEAALTAALANPAAQEKSS